MYKILRKYNKQMMAVFAVFLMIAFVATLGPRGGCGDMSPGAMAIGKIGDTPVTHGDEATADEAIRFLSQNVVVEQRDPTTGQRGWIPLLGLMRLDDAAFSQMRERPVMYYLLLTEARKMGLSPNPEQVKQLLADDRVAIATRDGRRVPFNDVQDENLKVAVQYHVGNMLMVMAGFQRALDAVKISQPMLAHEQATYQSIKVAAVEFPARDYEDKIPSPTDEQLQAQFKQYAEVEAGTQFGEANPFGFGYKYPNRVKLQYVCVPRDQVRKAVRDSKPDHRWKVDAVKYYDTHLTEFPATQPTPTTQEAFALGPVAAAKPAGPTTQPLDDQLTEQIINKLVDQQAEVLQRKIVSDITGKMAADFEAYRGLGATTAPASSAFESFEYVQGIAADVLARHKVTLKLASIADSLKSAKDLRELDGIGKVAQFPDYATNYAEAFRNKDERNVAGVLALYQAAKPVSEQPGGDQYIFRLTEADPAHAPATLDEVRAKVTDDWKHLQAFELARADANKLVEAARGKGLAAAAGDRKVVTTGPLNRNDPTPIEGLQLSFRGQLTFVNDAYQLLTQLAEGQKDHPMRVAGVPADAKAVAVELIAVESLAGPGGLNIPQSLVVQSLRQQYAEVLAQQWFTFDAVVQRTGFVDPTGQPPKGTN